MHSNQLNLRPLYLITAVNVRTLLLRIKKHEPSFFFRVTLRGVVIDKMLDPDENCSGRYGEGSRLAVSNDYLSSLGWKIEKTVKGFRFVNPKGKVFWSSKEVAKYLHDEAVEASSSTKRPSEAIAASCESESDADFQPSEIASTSEDCLSSPEKHVPVPFSVQKR